MVVLVRFAIGWFQRRNQPAFAGAVVCTHPTVLRREAAAPSYTATSAGPGRGAGLPVTQADLDQFERTLGEVQRAYMARAISPP